MIEIDGSQGEGGGQILRTALSLSLITGQPFRLANIRTGRSKPGLMRQHRTCVQAAQAIAGRPARCQATDAEGAEVQVGTTTLNFAPGPVSGGNHTFAIGSAGSCMMVLQTVLWPLVMAAEPSQLTLQGGTHNCMAPSFSFVQHMAGAFSGGAEPLYRMALHRHAFYPAGGGEVGVHIQPPAAGLAPIDIMARGEPVKAWAECLHAGIPAAAT